MKISEVINEADEYSPDPLKTDDGSIQAIADFIKENCSEWLSQTKNGKMMAYRGFKKIHRNDASAFRKKVRKDRRPLDSGADRHQIMDFLIKYGGRKANRSNSVFVSGDKGQADGYGTTFVTLPIGSFDYTWHIKHMDWSYQVYPHKLLLKKTNDRKPTDWNMFIDDILFRNFNYKAAKYWTVGKDPIEMLDPEPIKAWARGMGGDDGSLKKALKSGNEIMISCDEIIAIEPVIYEKVLLLLNSAK